MLDDDIELIEGLSIIHVKSLNAIVASDLHLGYEGIMAKRGVLIPKVNLKTILENFEKVLDKTKAKNIIINGDIKNEFSDVDVEEFDELYELIEFTKKKKVNLILIKGNHDNFVERYKEPFKLIVHRQEAKIGDYLFFHGEELPDTLKGVKTFIMGHEHPAIVIYDSVGRRVKLNCFLYGYYKKKRLLVLPALNYFAEGTAVNIEPKNGLLSPIFKEINIDKMNAIVVGHGATIDFGSISGLRSAAID